jgi:hypothetical protein
MASRTRRGAVLVATLASLAFFTLGVQAASATVIVNEHYSGTDSFSFTDCGTTFDVSATFSGHFVLRVDKRNPGVFLGNDNFSYRDVVTNRATGEWFVITGNGVFNEIRATQVSGTVYDIRAVEAGQPFKILDSAGNVVVRDRGVIIHTYLIDTLGDDDPETGEFLGEGPHFVHGPHPGFSEDFDFCAIALALTT